MPFGQLVVGPPGSGKSTYCHGMQQYLSAIGRKVSIVNLDPANDNLLYDCSVDIRELISLEEVMREFKLGPNGGLIYCMDYLESNVDWFREKLEPLRKDNCYLLFDCPGQIELLTLHASLKNIVGILTNKWHIRLASVHLVDAHLCGDAAKYISALLLSTNVMLNLELPHVNVLSKMDLIESFGRLSFSLEYYTEVHDLSFLHESMEETIFSKRFKKLSKCICEVVEDYSIVRFVPLAIEDKESMRTLLSHIDKATGFVFSTLPGDLYPPEFLYGAGVGNQSDSQSHLSLQEKYTANT